MAISQVYAAAATAAPTRASSPSCRQLTVKLTDGSVHRANFQFTR